MSMSDRDYLKPRLGNGADRSTGSGSQGSRLGVPLGGGQGVGAQGAASRPAVERLPRSGPAASEPGTRKPEERRPPGIVPRGESGSPKLIDAERSVPDLAELLRAMIDAGGSDLHVTSGVSPQVRVDGSLQALPYGMLMPKDTQRLLYSVMTEDQKAHLEEHLEVDFSFGLKDLARFRANVFYQRGSIAGALRLIPFRIPSFEELKLPEVLGDICELPRGLVVVTGPTGSGKSTTLAAMIDLINTTQSEHIITIEDPIEYLHKHKKCVVNQRELGADTRSFNAALKSALREDPDCVLIGELRDLESTALALKLAETGHLTFGTLHTNSAVGTINRIIDIFPDSQQGQIRTQLSFVLEAVVAQALLPHASGKGRVLVQEILIPNVAIRNMIREDKVHQVYSAMQSGQAEHGMKTFNQDLARLVTEKQITADVAMNATGDKAELASMLDRIESARRGRSKNDRELAERMGLNRRQRPGR